MYRRIVGVHALLGQNNSLLKVMITGIILNLLQVVNFLLAKDDIWLVQHAAGVSLEQMGKLRVAQGGTSLPRRSATFTGPSSGVIKPSLFHALTTTISRYFHSVRNDS